MPNHRQEFLNARKTGNIAVVDALLREDPSLVGARDHAGVSAVLLAQYSGKTDVVARLLANQSELDVFEAAAVGLNARLATLLDGDASLATESSAYGFAPLHLAAYFGHIESVRLLLKRGAPIDANHKIGSASHHLQSATAGRHLPIVELLLKCGANVNERQSGDWTALHSAAQHGDVAVVRELLRYGADQTALNAEGKNAARIAREAGHHELAAMLEGNRSIEERTK